MQRSLIIFKKSSNFSDIKDRRSKWRKFESGFAALRLRWEHLHCSVPINLVEVNRVEVEIKILAVGTIRCSIVWTEGQITAENHVHSRE